jgi:Protein of unknown function (DUF3987)
MTDLGLEKIDWNTDVRDAGQESTENVVPITNASFQPVPFEPDWPKPAAHLLRTERPAPPALDLNDLFLPEMADWVRSAAERKGAPPDYVAATVLSVAASAIGASRRAQVRPGWKEAPTLWFALIGNPSAGKSPALDAALAPFRALENFQRRKAEEEVKKWKEREQIAVLAKSAWSSTVKKAIKEGSGAPDKPAEMELGSRPHIPRLVVQDSTIERLADILSNQPRGTLMFRDELAGWLEGMSRYSSGSDRPFWLEAYGAGTFTVERMSRPPVTVQSLSACVIGGIQPDRLESLMLAQDDDGLLARFIPIWPNPAPITTPCAACDETYLEAILSALYGLPFDEDVEGDPRPRIIHCTDMAEASIDTLRVHVREQESATEGLLVSFLGKLPGMAVRLSLVLSQLDAACYGQPEPKKIEESHVNRAIRFLLNYALPMARRTYGEIGLSKEERRAIGLVKFLRENRLQAFTTREVIRARSGGLSKASDLNPVLVILEDGGVIRPIDVEISPKGGRPVRQFAVNPAALTM